MTLEDIKNYREQCAKMGMNRKGNLGYEHPNATRYFR